MSRKSSRQRALREAGKTDIGRERKENQDAFGSCQTDDGWDLFVVCDGMGGHAGGRTASGLAVETILDTCHLSGDEPRKRLNEAIGEANLAILDRAESDPELYGMGTTVVALLIDPKRQVAHLAHVGDSRCYLARDDQFIRLTRDHTMVQQLVDDGILSEEQAEDHPHANVISRSLGNHDSLQVDHCESPYQLEPGDAFLICSDGLSGPVREPELARELLSHSPKKACQNLIDLANKRGGHDNITVQIVHVGKPGPVPDKLEMVHPAPKPGSDDRVGVGHDRSEDTTRPIVNVGGGLPLDEDEITLDEEPDDDYRPPRLSRGDEWDQTDDDRAGPLVDEHADTLDDFDENDDEWDDEPARWPDEEQYTSDDVPPLDHDGDDQHREDETDTDELADTLDEPAESESDESEPAESESDESEPAESGSDDERTLTSGLWPASDEPPSGLIPLLLGLLLGLLTFAAIVVAV